MAPSVNQRRESKLEIIFIAATLCAHNNEPKKSRQNYLTLMRQSKSEILCLTIGTGWFNLNKTSASEDYKCYYYNVNITWRIAVELWPSIARMVLCSIQP
jgi:hypothetical protein